MSTVTAVPLHPVKRSYLVWLWVGILAALIGGVALARAADTGVVTTPTGLRYKVLSKGEGAATPTDSDVALVMYEGKLLDGTTFDKSQQPTPFPVGSVVPGFSEGLKLMHKGAKYRLWIPPQLGYGDRDVGPIPAGSTLVFDVQLLEFLPQEVIQQQMMQAPGAAGGPTDAPRPQ